MRVDSPKNSNVLVQKYGISSGVFPYRSRTAELPSHRIFWCESGTSNRSIFLVRKYRISSHSIFIVQKRNCGTSDLQVTDYSVCGGRNAELQVKALVWKRNCGTSNRRIFLVWKRNFKATIYSFCGIAELQTFKSHTILCAEAELRNFKSKYIVQKRNCRNSSRRIFFVTKGNLSRAARDPCFSHTWHSHCNSLGITVKAVSRVIPQHWKWQSVG